MICTHLHISFITFTYFPVNYPLCINSDFPHTHCQILSSLTYARPSSKFSVWFPCCQSCLFPTYMPLPSWLSERPGPRYHHHDNIRIYPAGTDTPIKGVCVESVLFSVPTSPGSRPVEPYLWMSTQLQGWMGSKHLCLSRGWLSLGVSWTGSNWTFSVLLRPNMSESAAFFCGVPQHSTLGLRLFALYMLTLNDIVRLF